MTMNTFNNSTTAFKSKSAQQNLWQCAAMPSKSMALRGHSKQAHGRTQPFQAKPMATRIVAKLAHSFRVG